MPKLKTLKKNAFVFFNSTECPYNYLLIFLSQFSVLDISVRASDSSTPPLVRYLTQ